MIRGKSIFDYFFILRPMLFLPGWSTLLAGYLIATRSDIMLSFHAVMGIDYPSIAWGMIAFGAAMGASFLLNQLCDIESDRENNKLFFLGDEIISKKEAIVETSALIVAALGFAVYLGYSVFILIVAFLILTGYLYNYSPFALKNSPLPSLIANALMGALAFAIGWMLKIGQPGWALLIDVLPYLFLNTALYFFTTLPDVDGDEKSDKKTFAVQLGLRRVVFFALFCFILAIVFAIENRDYFIGFILFLSAPQFIRLVFVQKVKYTIKTTKYTILFFSIAICLKIPLYVIMISGIILLTKWYYKRRFNFDYPNIKGV